MNRQQWLAMGWENEWIEVYCARHDKYETDEEQEDDNDDMCVEIFRLKVEEPLVGNGD